MSKKYLIFALIITILFISGCLVPPEEETTLTDVQTESDALSVQEIEQAKEGTNLEEVRQKCADLLEIDLETLSQPQAAVQQVPEPVVQEQQVVEIVEELVNETQTVEQTGVQIVYDENLTTNNSNS